MKMMNWYVKQCGIYKIIQIVVKASLQIDELTTNNAIYIFDVNKKVIL